ncbi:hypothetical protein GDO78_006182 [Eleutherodactylus coqui]|uniref:Uncharacterized protein n=1 Tax=Eleutherodactylus coqui TaxID=57060 RepID=A0A8J6FMT4_ELECQ|nr:hypothetical protein GDO78_006182 [Eleutherodactylus coqui]
MCFSRNGPLKYFLIWSHIMVTDYKSIVKYSKAEDPQCGNCMWLKHCPPMAENGSRVLPTLMARSCSHGWAGPLQLPPCGAHNLKGKAK